MAGGLLPLALRGQPPPRPAGVRVRLVPADVQHRLVVRHRLGHPEPAAQPLSGLLPPEQRCGQLVFTDHRPALGRPPTLVPIPAVLDEPEVGAAADRRGVQAERRHVAPVRGPLVVQGPRLGGGPHGERAPGNQDVVREPLGVGGCGRGGRGERGRARTQLMGDQHRLVVLLFVLRDHAEGEAGALQRASALVQRCALQQVQCPPPYVGGVRPGLGGGQQRQRGARGARVLEGVVQPVDLRAQRLPAADRAQQPLLLLVADVRQVPDQRRHQRGVLGGQFTVVHAVGEQGGALARGQQRVEGAPPQGLGVDAGRDGEAGRRAGSRRIEGVGVLAVPGVFTVLGHAEAAFPGRGGVGGIVGPATRRSGPRAGRSTGPLGTSGPAGGTGPVSRVGPVSRLRSVSRP